MLQLVWPIFFLRGKESFTYDSCLEMSFLPTTHLLHSQREHPLSAGCWQWWHPEPSQAWGFICLSEIGSHQINQSYSPSFPVLLNVKSFNLEKSKENFMCTLFGVGNLFGTWFFLYKIKEKTLFAHYCALPSLHIAKDIMSLFLCKFITHFLLNSCCSIILENTGAHSFKVCLLWILDYKVWFAS